ncbi:hypothetical protein K7G19_19815 [Cupriavidus sp. DB3]|uniref:hypothetical protein n=1 Tax=Cupriavidus sp. DB3 TaxID=2873259 RepID=UPI001CF0DD4D|nr:hypothetical protein [Cupriavidus sp. DB3]MCA7085840.1 hypothetical protein [Cupriavidus sp. DB3]
MTEVEAIHSIAAGPRPTARLRFVRRDGKLILQQAFESITGWATGSWGLSVEWRDVPVEEEGGGANPA